MTKKKPTTTREEDAKMTEALLNDIQAAKFLNLSPATLRNWRVQGRGPRFVTLGRAIRYNPKDLEKFIQTRTKQGEDA